MALVVTAGGHPRCITCPHAATHPFFIQKQNKRLSMVCSFPHTLLCPLGQSLTCCVAATHTHAHTRPSSSGHLPQQNEGLHRGPACTCRRVEADGDSQAEECCLQKPGSCFPRTGCWERADRR